MAGRMHVGNTRRLADARVTCLLVLFLPEQPGSGQDQVPSAPAAATGWQQFLSSEPEAALARQRGLSTELHKPDW